MFIGSVCENGIKINFIFISHYGILEINRQIGTNVAFQELKLLIYLLKGISGSTDTSPKIKCKKAAYYRQVP